MVVVHSALLAAISSLPTIFLHILSFVLYAEMKNLFNTAKTRDSGFGLLENKFVVGIVFIQA